MNACDVKVGLAGMAASGDIAAKPNRQISEHCKWPLTVVPLDHRLAVSAAIEEKTPADLQTRR